MSGNRGGSLTVRKLTRHTNPIARVFPGLAKTSPCRIGLQPTTQEEDSLGQAGPQQVSQSMITNATKLPTPKESSLDASMKKQEWMSLSRCVGDGPSKAGAGTELKLLTSQGDHCRDTGNDSFGHTSDTLVSPHSVVVESRDDELPSLHVDTQHLI